MFGLDEVTAQNRVAKEYANCAPCHEQYGGSTEQGKHLRKVIGFGAVPALSGVGPGRGWGQHLQGFPVFGVGGGLHDSFVLASQ